jgi:hypothetical protein
MLVIRGKFMAKLGVGRYNSVPECLPIKASAYPEHLVNRFDDLLLRQPAVLLISCAA